MTSLDTIIELADLADIAHDTGNTKYMPPGLTLEEQLAEVGRWLSDNTPWCWSADNIDFTTEFLTGWDDLADRYRKPEELDVIQIADRSGTVLMVHGAHDAIEVEHTDRSPPAELVTYAWKNGWGWTRTHD